MGRKKKDAIALPKSGNSETDSLAEKPNIYIDKVLPDDTTDTVGKKAELAIAEGEACADSETQGKVFSDSGEVGGADSRIAETNESHPDNDIAEVNVADADNDIAEVGEEIADLNSVANVDSDETDSTISEFTPLDELLYDMEEEFDSHETPEQTQQFESFLADYRLIISEALRSGSRTEQEEKGASFETAESKIEEIEVPYLNLSENGEEAVNADDLSENAKAGNASDDASESAYAGAESDISEPDNADEECEEGEAIVYAEQISIGDYADIFFSSEDAKDKKDVGLGAEASISDNGLEPRNAEENKDKYNPKKPRRIDAAFEFVELFIFTLVTVMVITTFFFRHSVVEGGSMQNTLQDGDHLIVYDFLYTPDYGDIIVFEDTESETRKALVKRVIGLEGDVVEIKSDGSVYVNGELLAEDYVYNDTASGHYTDSEGIWTVGEGQVFVLGDHRNISADSRRFGTINEDTILGKAFLRFYPFSSFGIVK